jgi:hypothetical protein
MKAAAVLGFIVAKSGSTLRKAAISKVQPIRTATPTRIAAKLQYLERDLKEELVPDLPGGMELPPLAITSKARQAADGRTYALAHKSALNLNGSAIYFTERREKRLINFAEFSGSWKILEIARHRSWLWRSTFFYFFLLIYLLTDKS